MFGRQSAATRMGDSGCRKCGEDGHFARFVELSCIYDYEVARLLFLVGSYECLHSFNWLNKVKTSKCEGHHDEINFLV